MTTEIKDEEIALKEKYGEDAKRRLNKELETDDLIEKRWFNPNIYGTGQEEKAALRMNILEELVKDETGFVPPDFIVSEYSGHPDDIQAIREVLQRLSEDTNPTVTSNRDGTVFNIKTSDNDRITINTETEPPEMKVHDRDGRRLTVKMGEDGVNKVSNDNHYLTRQREQRETMEAGEQQALEFAHAHPAMVTGYGRKGEQENKYTAEDAQECARKILSDDDRRVALVGHGDNQKVTITSKHGTVTIEDDKITVHDRDNHEKYEITGSPNAGYEARFAQEQEVAKSAPSPLPTMQG